MCIKETLDEYTCRGCKNVFYVPYYEELENGAGRFDPPIYCPFCGMLFDIVVEEE